MRRVLWLPLIYCWAILLMVGSFLPLSAAGGESLPPPLQKLDISVGRWVFHGQTLGTRSGKSGSWTWNEDCQWSPNHLYLECTFSNVWSGRAVESLVVDTYNSADHSYWHYELYAAGEKGSEPFVAPMEIKGNTWTEYGKKTIPGKQSGERIVYHWDRPNHVSVAIELSRDGIHWKAIDRGEGVKQH